jgi:hypothetical protein
MQLHQQPDMYCNCKQLGKLGSLFIISSLLPAGTFSSLKGVRKSTGFLLSCSSHWSGCRGGLNLLLAACRTSVSVCMAVTLTTCFCSA